jgi:hypothetical protein
MNLSERDLEFLVLGTRNLIRDYEVKRSNSCREPETEELNLAIEFLEKLLIDLNLSLEEMTVITR